MRSPVLFLLFNRPEASRTVFEVIREARPPRLYIAADGPRPDRPGEDILCAEARAVAEKVDWPCAVKTLFRKRNLGCATAVATAVTWFFSQEEEGVILEDDVLPHPDFFVFCDALLAYYRDEPKVMQISGDNFQLGIRRGDASYYFSRFAHIWGWASWARAWKHFDLSLRGLARFLATDMTAIVKEPAGMEFFTRHLRQVQRGVLDSWAVPWSYAVMRNGGVCVTPQENMVRNIGFGGGTHCLDRSLWAFLPRSPLGELKHPETLEPDDAADAFTCRFAFAPGGESLENLLAEGMARLYSGQAYANAELLRMARSFHGEHAALDYLDAMTSAAMGQGREAYRKMETSVLTWPNGLSRDVLLGCVRNILARPGTVVAGGA